jgi:origin recognition complex subunit 1
MDFMLSGKNTVLYNLLEWQSLKGAKLVLIGVANIMDLPERLAPKIRSRFGVHRIAFRAYNSCQLEQIIRQRLQSLQVFEQDAIELYSKSLAHQSGDVRRALMVCKRAAEHCMRRIQFTDQDVDLMVTSQDIQAVQISIVASAHMVRLREASKFEYIFIVALYHETKSKGDKDVGFESVVNRVALLCKIHSVSPIPRLSGLMCICNELERSEVIRVTKSRTTRYPRLGLTCSSDEIHDAFASHPIVKEYNFYIS